MKGVNKQDHKVGVSWLRSQGKLGHKLDALVSYNKSCFLGIMSFFVQEFLLHLPLCLFNFWFYSSIFCLSVSWSTTLFVYALVTLNISMLNYFSFIRVFNLLQPILLGLFENVYVCLLDPPKVVHFQRILIWVRQYFLESPSNMSLQSLQFIFVQIRILTSRFSKKKKKEY